MLRHDRVLPQPANARPAPRLRPVSRPASSAQAFARPPQIIDEQPPQFQGSPAFGTKNGGGMISSQNPCAQGMPQLLPPRSLDGKRLAGQRAQRRSPERDD